ncbi:hypothetical protein [Ignicoccus hospitalis]|uniref:Uncharacterized protein n=1 Tax=Ignicoccus hospitalis (strain KIN4/I / DSM 18386 / JCM 14125) TaxID=453591 RepID=A8AC47_IGNH4|nr:hypothetical protein [Ignicoccus hospitalis]ABU82499.1 hypothetical protein Igni_1323 [Ignicoccus hospitalis KIN4/I]HIH90596.1 hypothetical protein [Desulfurococcaceae archaeon]
MRKVVPVLLALMALAPAAFAAEANMEANQYLTDDVFAKYQALHYVLLGIFSSLPFILAGTTNIGVGILVASIIYAAITYFVTLVMLQIARKI